MTENRPVLRFHPDGHFRILMISDMHIEPSRDKADRTDLLIAGIDALLENTCPDFVFIAGDQCLSDQTKEDTRAHFMTVLEPILRRDLPWATVFGNHDREMGLPLDEEEAVYESIPGCLSEAGPCDISGVGNYCLRILSSQDDNTAFHLWALDSQSESKREFVQYLHLPADTRFVMPKNLGNGSWQGGVLFDQVLWYYHESKRREEESGRKIPALMFLHIPLPEFCVVEWNPEECDAVGNRRECVCCPELNSGLFMACLERGDVKGIFCGHEHLNDFDGTYCGIKLGYDGCVGFSMSAHDDIRGGRVIDLCEDGTFTTRTVKLMSIMGEKAIRNPDFFEGGCKYFFRVLP